MKVIGDRNPKTLMAVLVGVVIVLALLVVYAFILKPTLNGYAVKLQNEGVTYTLDAIISQVGQNGYVQLPVGNQTVTLILPELCSEFPQNSSGLSG